MVKKIAKWGYVGIVTILSLLFVWNYLVNYVAFNAYQSGLNVQIENLIATVEKSNCQAITVTGVNQKSVQIVKSGCEKTETVPAVEVPKK